MELRPYQCEAVDAVVAAWSAGEAAVCLGLPTGAGKTVIAAEVARGMAAEGLRAAMLTDRLALLPHTRQTMEAAGLRVGIVQGGRTDPREVLDAADVLLCSTQTVEARGLDHSLLGVQAAIVDEAHVEWAVYRRWLADAASGLRLLGLTATPLARWMTDDGCWTRLVSPVGTAALIADGVLLAPVFDVRFTAPDTDADRSETQEVSAPDAEEIMSPHSRAIAAAWRALVDEPAVEGGYGGAVQPTMVLGATWEHCTVLADAFRRAGGPGVQVRLVTDRQTQDETEDILRRFALGEVHVVVSVHKLSIGVDVPDATVLVAARPVRSLLTWAQAVGRLMRRPDSERGSARVTVLDCAGNAARHAAGLHAFWARGARWPFPEATRGGAPVPLTGQGVSAAVCPAHPATMQVPGAQVCRVCHGPLRPVDDAGERTRMRVDAVTPLELGQSIMALGQRRLLTGVDIERVERWMRVQVHTLSGRWPRRDWPRAGWHRGEIPKPHAVVRRTQRRNAARWKEWTDADPMTRGELRQDRLEVTT